MNAVQTLVRVDYYNNLTASARFTLAEVAIAVNDAIQQFVDEKIGNDNSDNPESFQWTEQIRSDLYTLITVASPSVSNGATITTRYGSFIPSSFTTPSDFYFFISLSTLIDGYSSYAKPTSYNEIGPLLQDSFKMPSSTQTYYVEANGTYTVWRGSTGTFTSVGLTYIKTPTTYSCGQESQLIDGGAAVTLTNGTTYYATQVSVYNGTTYVAGATITGVTAQILTSGQVILASNTVPIVLPDKTHEDICKMASQNLLKTVSMFDNAAAIASEISKT